MLGSLQNVVFNRQKEKPTSRPLRLLLAALIAAFFASSCGTRTKTATAPPFSAEMWLKWDKPSRIAFIMGNLRGYWDGIAAGCGDAMRAVASLPGVTGFTREAAQDMRMDCGNRYKPSNRPLESYEEVVTDLYTRYPKDRAVDVQDVLHLLAGDAKLTADDVDEHIEITVHPKAD